MKNVYSLRGETPEMLLRRLLDDVVEIDRLVIGVGYKDGAMGTVATPMRLDQLIHLAASIDVDVKRFAFAGRDALDVEDAG